VLLSQVQPQALYLQVQVLPHQQLVGVSVPLQQQVLLLFLLQALLQLLLLIPSFFAFLEKE
jgi:hypothetical protein